MKVAFAGLGVMGFPMAGHLAKAGHEMAVFNRSPEKAARWVAAHGGRAGATVADAAAGAEGLNFAQRAGLDGAKLVEVISKGAAQSWQMDNRWKTMTVNKFDFGFAVDWMRKDLGLVLDEAGRNGAALDMTRMVDGFYAEVQALGGRRWDTSSLVARLGRA